MRKLKLGKMFPHVLAYPDQNAVKSCKGGGGEELSRIEHAAKQQQKVSFTILQSKPQVNEAISSC